MLITSEVWSVHFVGSVRRQWAIYGRCRYTCRIVTLRVLRSWL